MSPLIRSRRQLLGGLAACALAGPALAKKPQHVGGIKRMDARLDAIIDPSQPIEILSEGYRWAEGPVWVERGGYLLFSDVPANVAYRWSSGRGVQPFLTPSGLAGAIPPGVREAGSNGLAIDGAGRLVLADSGTRAIATIDLATRRKMILVDRYEGKRFNSPNDLAIARSDAIYFTDPPYGLDNGDESPLRELSFNGLYRLAPDGSLALLDGSHRRPNGVALSPDERTLYLALSEEKRPEVLAYSLDARGFPTGMRRFRDMRSELKMGWPGLPDGIKCDPAGNVFATGPGGLHVCSREGQLLGIVMTGKPIANCAFGEDGRSLFLTSSDMLARIRLKRGRGR
ncbi:SMP-30/gluconolactonase/LRE family protein [Sphingomonas cavernae]|uniref:SMP-30/gluconolactonase/LRE family protein n=1 Tax=Sphingomonas cavernae TaxID=2320861 RepID=A0A418WNF5_9SPHN|nr:SMP-30/gluconolactonase/LRE family protein [Sphingomonas cavernae]RJF91535.1 SMP-30/gluconolactonase/LRE family protein [Sphingomonas cavernae]